MAVEEKGRIKGSRGRGGGGGDGCALHSHSHWKIKMGGYLEEVVLIYQHTINVSNL